MRSTLQAPLRKTANGPKSDVDLTAKARTRPQTFATPVDAVQARAAVAAAKAPMQTSTQTMANSSNVVESLESMLRQAGIKVTPATGAQIVCFKLYRVTLINIFTAACATTGRTAIDNDRQCERCKSNWGV
jgi:hypothetical protein